MSLTYFNLSWRRRPRQESEAQRLPLLRQRSAPHRSSSFVYPGFWKERNTDLEDIITLYFDSDMVPPQGTGRLLDLQTPVTVQPSEPPLQDTVSPSEDFPQESGPDDLRAISETTSTEVKSSATATDSEAQQPSSPRNVTPPIRSTHIMNTGNASESPAEVTDTFQPLSERKHAGVEVSGTTTSKGDGFAADRDTMGSANSLPSSPEEYQTNANLSGGRFDPEGRPPYLKAGQLDPYSLRTLRQPTTALNDEMSLSVGSAETIPGGPPSPDQGTTDAVGANLSERRGSEVDPPVTDTDAADSHDPAQTPRQPFPVLPHDQGNPSVGHAETDPGNTSSPPSNSQPAIDGVGAHRDASSSVVPPLDKIEYVRRKMIDCLWPPYTEDEITDMAARDYDLEHLKNGITVDEFNRRIDRWKEIEEFIARNVVPFPFDPLDYGEEWLAFYGVQVWYRRLWHRKRGGNFPSGYRTLFDSSKDEILRRSPFTRDTGRSRTTEATER